MALRSKRKNRHYERYAIPPLSIQVESGSETFTEEKKQWIKKLSTGKKIVITSNPYPQHTMQAKEWQRGYNKAYFENLNELRTRG